MAGAALALTGCGKPNVTALQKLACEQAAASVDLQSVQQLDTLRKALGVAPNVDPLAFCSSIGAVMPSPSPPSADLHQQNDQQNDQQSGQQDEEPQQKNEEPQQAEN
ncbi:MAG: hypothetical protein ACKO7Z_09055 [Cyanobacteriota bacterium]